MRPQIGDEVKLSTAFLRSIGLFHRHAEHAGRVLGVAYADGSFTLLSVEWQDGHIGTINARNLVVRRGIEVSTEARVAAERLPGVGASTKNTFARFEENT